ncbi:alpha/beta-hydrolase [Xylariomycetidae sp. FL2044]|nr:alpha/beta-hydrolase [Xylariomycetidae sp. FL2044]
MKSLSILSAAAAIPTAMAAVLPQSDTTSPTQTTLAIPAGTVVGSIVDSVEYFRGIPYAKPPTGSSRLRPPQRLEPFDTLDATGLGPACPQFLASTYPDLLVEAIADPFVSTAIFLGSALGNETEDCLAVSVMRPQGTSPHDQLPVVFWIHGGGFDIGSAQPYNASVLIPYAVEQDKPFILVGVNYRLGGFGFLGGGELLADGSTNLGLLDQRMALEWVADNIAAFGGDPGAVTIMGESAGSFSVFDQLALYDGDNLYQGRPLFRAGIMHSGSVLPQEPVDGERAQEVFDTVAAAADCPSEEYPDTLECLRSASYETFLAATYSVPNFLSNYSVALSYAPRPDGKTLTASTHILAEQQKLAKVPIIVGDLQDEGSIFGLFVDNITTKDELVDYLSEVFFHHATREEITALVDTYPDMSESPDGPAAPGAAYPEFNRLAAVIGDIEFTLSRRIFLETLSKDTPAWSWLASWQRGTPLVGTFHTSDLPRVFYGTDAASCAMQNRYFSFIYDLDPNGGAAESEEGFQTFWPTWQDKRELLDFGADATALLADDFRADSFEYIKAHMETLRF